MAIMLIRNIQWRLEIGIFNTKFCRRFKYNALGLLTPLLYIIVGISIMLPSVFLLLSGNIELNPGPSKKN